VTDLLTRPQPLVEPSSGHPEVEEHYLPITKRKALLAAVLGFPTSFEMNVIRQMMKGLITFVKKQWSNLMLAACLAGFMGLAGFALSLADNYRCAEGEHTLRNGQSAWSVASQRCSGDIRHAMRDIITINGGDPTTFRVGDTLIVPPSGG
jgi:hypothetical protein